MSESGSANSMLERWRTVLSAGSGLYNLVDSSHPLEIYMGANAGAQPTLTLVLRDRPPQVAKFDYLQIEQRKREDGTWLLLLQLKADVAFAEFATMCSHLVESSSQEKSQQASLIRFIEVLELWRHLFKPAETRLLGDSQLRGLAAELIFIKDVAVRSCSWAEAIYGWVGPARAPQDFRLPGGRFVEVKSVHLNSKSVQIASIDQLDIESSELLLATVVVEREVERKEGTFTIPDLADSIESAIGADLDLLSDFRAKLREIAFESSEIGYQEMHFFSGEIRVFEVRSDFPRLHRSELPNDILLATYELSVLGLDEFEHEIDELFGGPKWK
jgi:hypothetical protein